MTKYLTIKLLLWGAAGMFSIASCTLQAQDSNFLKVRKDGRKQQMIKPIQQLPFKLLPRNGKMAFIHRRKMSMGRVPEKGPVKLKFNKNRRSKGKEKSKPYGKERFIRWRKG